jgi:AcrR family transcriptional regulator
MSNTKTKELLINKAISLFYKKGYSGTSIREIVKAAGVTNSAVYHHFRDKDHLLRCINERIGDELIKSTSDIQSKYDHPLDKLRQTIFQHTCLVKEKRVELKVFLEEEYRLSPKNRKKIRDQYRIIYDLHMKNLSDLEKMGLLRPVDKTVINFTIFALINWCYRWFREEGRLSIEEIANYVVDILFNGILKHRQFKLNKECLKQPRTHVRGNKKMLISRPKKL